MIAVTPVPFVRVNNSTLHEGTAEDINRRAIAIQCAIHLVSIGSIQHDPHAIHLAAAHLDHFLRFGSLHPALTNQDDNGAVLP